MKTINIIKLPGLMIALGLLCQTSYATLSFQSVTTSAGGAAVNATAAISISGSTMTVTLIDLQANPSSVGSLLNGVTINMSGVTGVSGLTADAATTVTVAGDGSFVTSSASGSTIASQWGVSGSSAITLSALATGPNYLIIGPPGYGGANSSIAGNGPHNPFISQQETFYFTLSGPGSFSENNISGLTFLFGTSSDYGSGRQVLTSVPEPSTIVAGALLLLPFGISTVRILRKNKQS
jgi:hypothetical protein